MVMCIVQNVAVLFEMIKRLEGYGIMSCNSKNIFELPVPQLTIQ